MGDRLFLKLVLLTAGLPVAFPPGDVLLTGHAEIRFDSGLMVLKDFFQKGDAPTTAGPGAIALRELRGRLRLVQAAVFLDLLKGNMKADANVVMTVHGATTLGAGGLRG